MLNSRFGLFASEPPVSDCGHTNCALPVYLTHFKRIYVAFSVQPGIFVKQTSWAGRFSNLVGQRGLESLCENSQNRTSAAKAVPGFAACGMTEVMP